MQNNKKLCVCNFVINKTFIICKMLYMMYIIARASTEEELHSGKCEEP